MSGQQPPRLKTSPKQGPLRATMPMAFVTKEGSGLSRPSPDLSPPPSCSISAPGIIPKSNLRRTASLDSSYIRGRFPTSPPKDDDKSQLPYRNSISLDSIEKTLMSGSSPPIESRFAHLTVEKRAKSSGSSPKAITKSSRSSEEGLNQEIAQLTSRSSSDPNCDRLRLPTPGGRKAPVADLYRICAIPPQMINSFGFSHQDSSPSPAHGLNSDDSPDGSSPDQDTVVHQFRDDGSSPRTQRFTNRGPPDGCERVVTSKTCPPLCKPIPIELAPQPRSFFTLTPSSGSAFNSLNNQRPKADDTDDDDDDEDVPIVPHHKTN